MVMVQEFADGGDLFNLLQKYGGRLHERAAVSLVLEPFLRVLQVRRGGVAAARSWCSCGALSHINRRTRGRWHLL